MTRKLSHIGLSAFLALCLMPIAGCKEKPANVPQNVVTETTGSDVATDDSGAGEEGAETVDEGASEKAVDEIGFVEVVVPEDIKVEESTGAEPSEEGKVDEVEAKEAEYEKMFPMGIYAESKKVALGELADKDAYDAFIKENKIAVVKFGAEWCYWCHVLRPYCKRMNGYYDGKVAFAEIDSDANQELAKSLKVGGIPHSVVFVDGEIYANVIGADPERMFTILEAAVKGEPAPEEEGEKIVDEEDSAEEVETVDLDDVFEEEPTAEETAEEDVEEAK